MKRFKKIVLGMLMIALLAGASFAYQAGTAAADETDNKFVTVSAASMSSGFSQVQYKKFMSYLTHEYAPELQTAWEKAIDERQSVEPVLQIIDGTIDTNAITITKKTTGVEKDFDLEKLTPVSEKELQEIMKNAKLPEGADVKAYKGNNADGEVVSVTIATKDANNAEADTVKTGCFQINGSSNYVMNFDDGIAMDAGLTLQNELDQAITNNDSKAIKSTLEKMLDNYKQTTEELKTTLSKVEAIQK
ncbi:MAG: hypothetical protein H6Q64_1062 [Firmicutes bacterium]|nr:hypothetical protein [Bacillota bacterium]